MNHQNATPYPFERIQVQEERTRILLDAERILSFSPHPDDLELIAGGYLASSIDRKAEVKLVVVSDDRMSFNSIENELPTEKIVAIRKDEETKAVEVLGIRDTQFLEYPDSDIPEPKFLMNDFLAIIRSYEPDVVVSVDPCLPYEAHPDHLNTGNAILRAVLFHQFPYVLKSTRPKSKPPVIALGATAYPNAIVSIEGSIDRKVKSILCHRTQFPNPEGIEKKIRSVASTYGGMINSRYGEAFNVLFHEEIHMGILALG